VANLTTPSPYLDRLNCYVQSVLNGETLVSSYVMKAVERHRRDLEDERFVLDPAAIDEALGFIETQIPYIRGDATGDMFQLLPWQVFTLGSLVGWKWQKTGERRFRFAILELARGQGKTTMMSAYVTYHLVKGPPGTSCYNFGPAERVSLLCFNDTKKTLMSMGKEAGTRIRPRRLIGDQEWIMGYRDIREGNSGSFLEALPAKETTADGLDPSLVIADEAAEYQGRSFDKITTSTVKRQSAQVIAITTPGSGSDPGIYMEHRDVATAVLDGEHDQADGFYYLAGMDPDDDIEDQANWIKANPSLGTTCQVDDLQRRYEQAKKAGASAVRAWRRFHGCQWVGHADPWIDLPTWDKLNKGPRPDLKGRRCWAGLDLSKSRDMSSLIALIEADDGLWIYGQHWYPETTALERQTSYRMPLIDWGANGHLTLCPGGVIDYDSVEAACLKLNDQYDLQGIWADPMFCSQLEQRCEASGVPFGTLKQSIQYLSPGTIKTEELIAEGKLFHDGDPVLRSATQHCRVYRDINLNARLCKKSSTGLIDSAMALTIAVSCYITVSPESVYEHSDLKVFG